MKYLDQVINETLRKWPSVLATDRVCVKDYVYDDGQLNFKIEKGSVVTFSIFELHHNPIYYPNPDKFDPDRFSDENKHNITPGTFAAFGQGPRNCIGSRFALMEIKVILYTLLLNFTFEANEKTQIPIKLRKIELAAKHGVHLELKPRKISIN
ncbi:cytochrome P450 9e2-like [Bradysia coprophila]|uniref:cytochrome P450 9e2-like n=1 Tax=Bradysia coprophila TaxID=38358 RepID=UPI00187D76C0|nr:cytochrome P450 9e2-like [Bradysia coprophila]